MLLESPAQIPALSAEPASQSLPEKLKHYFTLGKPGIALSVIVTAFVGYLKGISSDPAAVFSTSTLLHLLFGTFLVSMGAGTLNMLLESETDALMRRTQSRPIPSGKTAGHEAFFLGCIAASLGVVHLAGTVNMRASFIAGLGLVLYLVFYTPMKRTSAFSTVVGAVSGALPPLIGWSASKAAFGAQAWTLFAILFLWQFPHFLILFWIYRADFKQAGIRTLLNDEEGSRSARAGLVLCIAVALSAFLPYFLGMAGLGYLAACVLLNGFLIRSAWQFYRGRDAARARAYFLSTVIYLPLLFLSLAIGL